MEIICNQNELNNSIQLVSKAVASRPTHPILANILLTADQGTNKISLTGYDLSLGIQTSFNGKVKNSGAITIPAKYFLEIVNKLPNESPINIDLQDSSEDIILKSNKAVFNLKGKFIDDFPSLPIVEKGTSFTTDPSSFLRCIKLTVFSADSENGPGEILKGVNFTFTKGYIEAASTDRHRLAIASINDINNDFHQESEININEEPLSITIPTRSLREIEKLLTLKSNEKSLKIFYDKGQIIFDFKNQIITSGTLEGKFPPYRALLPDKFYKIFRFDRVELINVLERISVFRDFRENRSIVKIDLNDENHAIFSSEADIGKANESLPLDLIEGKYDKQFINTRPYLKSERVVNNEGELYVALEDIEEGRQEPFHKDLSNPEEIKITEQKTKWRHLGTAISATKGMVFNVSYLLEGLKVISSSNVLLKCTVSNKPALLVSETHPNEFTYLVMPCGFR